jgi:magnesium transporter
MLRVYVPRGSALERREVQDGADLPAEAVWIDLVSPAPGEDKVTERLVGIAVPTREEMQEIELSSRLYEENGARYMTATLMCQQDTPTPKTTPVTFILANKRLVTVRYDEPKPFAIVGHKLGRSCPPQITGETVFLDLFDAVIDRTADILEKIAIEIEDVSRGIFESDRRTRDRPRFYRTILTTIGRKGDHTSKVRESLVSIGRVVLFLAHEAEGMKWNKDKRAQLDTMHRDVQSLSDYATYLSNKSTFLLDAMLGMVSIEQNNVIKIFSMVAVVLMPPTLVATIYGMNFRHMPELDWTFGYPMAIAVILLAAILPYYYFKWRRWL